MKLVVDELPEKPSDCLFVEDNHVFCTFSKLLCSICVGEKCAKLMSLDDNYARAINVDELVASEENAVKDMLRNHEEGLKRPNRTSV